MNKRTYTVAEAAGVLGIGLSLAYEMVRTGRIPSLKLGGRWLIPQAAVEKMLQEAEETALKT